MPFNEFVSSAPESSGDESTPKCECKSTILYMCATFKMCVALDVQSGLPRCDPSPIKIYSDEIRINLELLVGDFTDGLDQTLVE